jgi:hypothetical protein
MNRSRALRVDAGVQVAVKASTEREKVTGIGVKFAVRMEPETGGMKLSWFIGCENLTCMVVSGLTFDVELGVTTVPMGVFSNTAAVVEKFDANGPESGLPSASLTPEIEIV